MDGNTPARRARAVSFTVQITEAEQQADGLNTAADQQLQQQLEQQTQESQLSQQSLVLDKKTSDFQELLDLMSAAILTAITAQEESATTECVNALNKVSSVLEQEEEEYMASPIRCPLIQMRHESSIGAFANMAAESLANDEYEVVLLTWVCESSQFEGLRVAACRLLCILVETQPHLAEEYGGLLNTMDTGPNKFDELLRQVIISSRTELRNYQTGLLGMILNDRKTHEFADIAVVPVEVDDPEDSSKKNLISLPKVLAERIKNELGVEQFEERESSSHITLRSTSLELEYTLRCLSFLGEYQETLGPVLDLGIMGSIISIISSSQLSSLVKVHALELCSRLIAHKSFAMRFAAAKGVDMLLDLASNCPRPLFLYPSIAWCLSGIATIGTVMERVLRTVQDASKKLVDFGLNLLRGEQDITRKNALFFFAHAFSFPAILHQFDLCDGCKVLLDLVANPVATQRTIAVVNLVKHYVITLRQYFRAHVAQTAHVVRTTRVVPGEGSRPRRAMAKRLPLNKPLQLDNASHVKNLDTLRSEEVMAFLTQTKWRPIEELLQYRSDKITSGIALLFGLIKACGRTELGSNAQEICNEVLHVLSISSILPVVLPEICSHPTKLSRSYFRGTSTISSTGVSDLVNGDQNSEDNSGGAGSGTGLVNVENISESDDEDLPNSRFALGSDETGISVLLRIASSNGSFDDFNPRALLASLQTLVNCVCSDWSGDESLHRHARRLARNNNAVMILLALLNYKEKPSDADPIRYYACYALVGLSRDTEVADILRALNIDRLLSEIATSEPVIAENRVYHNNLKEMALKLINTISSSMGREEDIALAADAAARKIARDAIVRRSHVQWDQKELMFIIHEHLEKHGCSNAAKALAKEAGLFVFQGSASDQTPVPAAQNKRILRPWPSSASIHPRLHSSSRRRVLRSSASTRKAKRLPFTRTPGKFLTPSAAKTDEEYTTPSLASSVASNKRKARVFVDGDSEDSNVKRLRPSTAELSTGALVGPSTHPTRLEKIVREHLRHEHRLCHNPITVPPPFSLLDQHHHHKCPDSKAHAQRRDVATHIFKRTLLPPYGGPNGREFITRTIHSKAHWTRQYGLSPDMETQFTSTAFRKLTGSDDQIAIGTGNGAIHRFNVWNTEHVGAWDLYSHLENDATMSDFSISDLSFSTDGSRFLTNFSDSKQSVIWRVLDENDALVAFRLRDAEHAILDADSDTIAAYVQNVPSPYSSSSTSSGVALYNMETGDQIVRFFSSQGYNCNDYRHKNLCMSAGGGLVCYDGVLWDARRSPRPIHKFDKLSEFGWGSLHPNGLQLLLNKDVWDLRTYRIVQSCSNALNGSTFRFDPFGDVIYSYQDVTVHQKLNFDSPSSFQKSVVVTDGTDYSNVASQNIKRNIYDLTIHPGGGHFAVLVSDQHDMPHAECRLYEIGRSTLADDDSDADDGQVGADDNDSASEDDEEEGDDHMDGDDDFDEGDEIILGDLGGDQNIGDAILRAINMMHTRGNGDEDEDEDDLDEYELDMYDDDDYDYE